MRIEILTVPDCPNRVPMVEAVREALAALHRTEVTVLERTVTDDRTAFAGMMHGSPTILVDGVDPFADPGAAPSVSCRLYRDGGSVAGRPSVERLREVLGE